MRIRYGFLGDGMMTKSIDELLSRIPCVHRRIQQHYQQMQAAMQQSKELNADRDKLASADDVV